MDKKSSQSVMQIPDNLLLVKDLKKVIIDFLPGSAYRRK
jgi:hypothetical protein